MTDTKTICPPCPPNAGPAAQIPPCGEPCAPIPVIPAEVTVDGVDCDGNPISVTGAGVVQNVPHPDTVQKVQICNRNEFDHTILCDPVTGDNVIVVTLYDPETGIPTSSAYLMDSTPYAGPIAALVACPDSDLESDALEMCDVGTTFWRWIVKQDGEPTGTFFDTDLAGAPYTPVGPVIPGACGCIAGAPVGILSTWG